MAPWLEVTFEGESQLVDPSDPNGLVFGRGAALDIDSNPFLHRQVGRFVALRGLWWVENLSTWTTLFIDGCGSAAMIPASGRFALAEAKSVVRFAAGSCNYELRADLPTAPGLDTAASQPSLVDPTATYRPVAVPLTYEQRLLVVALAEQRLLDPLGRPGLPTNRDVALRLGWSQAKFNRKLDWLCSRLDRAGIVGMRETGRRANDRRRLLVEHMISAGSITTADLALLDDLPAATS